MIEYIDYGGYGLFEGDILIQTQENELAGLNDVSTHGVALINPAALWPDGVVQYMIDDSATEKNLTAATNVINEAINYLENISNLDFIQVPYFDLADCNSWECPSGSPTGGYIRMINGNGCYSLIGYQGGRNQELGLGRGCKVQGIILHEILHSLGFFMSTRALIEINI